MPTLRLPDCSPSVMADALLERRVAASPSDADLEAAHSDLQVYADLTPRARRVLVALTDADLQSARARDLFAAMNDWDNAGTGDRRLSAREHERVWMRIGAALLDQVMADRDADPNLVAELAASVGVRS